MSVVISELVNEITNDPQGLGYKVSSVWKGNSTIFNIINTPYVNGYVPISPEDLLKWAAQSGRYIKLIDARDNTGNSDSVRTICAMLVKIMDGGVGNFDLSISAFSSAIDALVTATVLSAADRTALQTASTQLVSRAYELWKTSVSINHVRAARYAS